MKTPLNYLFQSECADDVISFLRSRGQQAHIIAPQWVQQHVRKSASAVAPELSASWSSEVGVESGPPEKRCNVIVVAEDAVKEQAITESLRAHKGVKIYGLFRDVVPALLCGANGMAVGKSTRNLKRYVLFCVPRSGSRYLAAVLGNQGLGSPREHLREPLANIISQGKLDFAPAISALERYGQRNNIFGTKLISTFLIKASHNRFSELTANVNWMIGRGYRAVHLQRPLNDTVVSSYIAFLMRKWHFFGELNESSRAKLDGLAFDGGGAWEEYIRFRAEHIVVASVARRTNMLSINYSEIQANVDEVVARIRGHIGIGEENLQGGSMPIPVATRPESRTYGVFAERLAEVLEQRRNELDARTVNKIRALTALDKPAAERLIAESTS